MIEVMNLSIINNDTDEIYTVLIFDSNMHLHGENYLIIYTQKDKEFWQWFKEVPVRDRSLEEELERIHKRLWQNGITYDENNCELLHRSMERNNFEEDAMYHLKFKHIDTVVEIGINMAYKHYLREILEQLCFYEVEFTEQ